MKKYFLAGLLFWLPILATYVVIRFIFKVLDNMLAILPQAYQPTQIFGHHVPGLGLVIALLLIFFTGILVTNIIGNKLVEWSEKLLSRIPIIRSIYNAVKQVANAFFKPQSESFRKVLMVEYPRKGCWSIGFQTGSKFYGTPSNQEMVTVFIPTTPNPTSGFLIILPVAETYELSMSVEEAFKTIVSLGVFVPTQKLIIKPNTNI